VLPEFLTLTARDGRISTALSGREASQFRSESLQMFLQLQRWFAGKNRTVGNVGLQLLCELDDGGAALSIVSAEVGGDTQDYFMPLVALWGEDHLSFGAPTLSSTLARMRRGPNLAALADGSTDAEMNRRFLRWMKEGARVAAADGEIRFHGGSGLPVPEELDQPAPLAAEQSNVCVAFGADVVMKIYRRLRWGAQPDIEVARFLTETARFPHTPARTMCVTTAATLISPSPSNSSVTRETAGRS
jgi:maltose alpha-D-glucosyltransferase/alpha-amylase